MLHFPYSLVPSHGTPNNITCSSNKNHTPFSLNKNVLWVSLMTIKCMVKLRGEDYSYDG